MKKEKISVKNKFLELINSLLEKLDNMVKNKKRKQKPVTAAQKHTSHKQPKQKETQFNLLLSEQKELPIENANELIVAIEQESIGNKELNTKLELSFVELPPQKTISAEWVVGAASCIGLGHINKNLPCQDNHHIEHWDEQSWWGIAICCDGAGSAKKSDQGSEKVAKDYIPQQLKKELATFRQNNIMPTLEEWQKIAMHALLESVRCLQQHADEQQSNLKEFACTVIVVVFTPFGLLQCNIGDGRACYRDEKGEWLALMKPYKPDSGEANVTVFLTSNIWDSPNKALQYIGFNIVKNATAFALMSDGCENYMFICSPVDPETGEDPNQPQVTFFEPLYKYVADTKLTESEIDENIKRYLENNSKLKKEQDDKTLLLAINCVE